jgi:hypothetical protein
LRDNSSLGRGLFGTVDLQQADLGMMGKENGLRLLGKFFQPFFQK